MVNKLKLDDYLSVKKSLSVDLLVDLTTCHLGYLIYMGLIVIATRYLFYKGTSNC